MIETYDEGRGWVAFGSGIQRLSKVSGEFLKFSHNFKKNIDAGQIHSSESEFCDSRDSFVQFFVNKLGSFIVISFGRLQSGTFQNCIYLHRCEHGLSINNGTKYFSKENI